LILIKKIILAFAILIIVLTITTVLGHALIENDTIQTADAIVVIGGDHKPERIKRAVELYQQGLAPIVIISAGTLVIEGGQEMHEAQVMQRQAIVAGLPENVILIENQSKSTYENAKFTKPILEQQNAKSILLVTSTFHRRRAKQIFNDAFTPEIAISVQPAESNWWARFWILNPDSMYVVLYEYKNWALYWLGIGTN
jgi:uncharacterized SAM-binding protein YcdF (DUF218 family)